MNTGMGVSLVLVAELDNDRFYIEPMRFDTRAQAFTRAAELVAMRPSSEIVAGASLAKEQALQELNAISASRTEFVPALPLLRELVAESRIRHFNSTVLSAQLADARVVVNPAEQLVPQIDKGKRYDTLKAMLWALYSMATAPPLQPVVW